MQWTTAYNQGFRYCPAEITCGQARYPSIVFKSEALGVANLVISVRMFFGSVAHLLLSKWVLNAWAQSFFSRLLGLFG